MRQLCDEGPCLLTSRWVGSVGPCNLGSEQPSSNAGLCVAWQRFDRSVELTKIFIERVAEENWAYEPASQSWSEVQDQSSEEHEYPERCECGLQC